MINVSQVYYDAPSSFSTPLQGETYKALKELDIPFRRVENDPAVTMEDCVEINKKLECKTVKTLFLCNRQKTAFYLYIMPDGRPFVTKDFSHTLGISRVSFAPPELLKEMVGVEVGATTVFGLLLDKEAKIRVVIESDVIAEEEIGCTDGTTTGYMCVKTKDIIERFLPYAKHEFEVI